MANPMILLDGASLTTGQVTAVARYRAQVAIAESGRAAAAAAARVAAEVTAVRPVYGRTTGVGANRDQLVQGDDVERSGLRLMRSHAGGAGPLIAAELSRAMLVVRLATIGEAAVACHDLAGLLTAGTLIAAFSHLAVDGSTEPYAEPVHRRSRRAGQQAVAAQLRLLLGHTGRPAARIQDPYGYRALSRSTPGSPPSRPGPPPTSSRPTGRCWPASSSPRSAPCGCSASSRPPARWPTRTPGSPPRCPPACWTGRSTRTWPPPSSSSPASPTSCPPA